MIEHNKLKHLKEGGTSELNIVSAGPSLRDMDFNLIGFKDIMTLNNSILHLPQNIRSKYHIYCEPVLDEATNYTQFSSNHRTKCFSIHECPGWYQVQPFDGIENFAFQVAILIGKWMKYQTINLYGYDFSFQDGYKYWWSEERVSDEEIKKKSYILSRQKTIFNGFIDKISKDIKINIVGTNNTVTVEEYLNE